MSFSCSAVYVVLIKKGYIKINYHYSVGDLIKPARPATMFSLSNLSPVKHPMSLVCSAYFSVSSHKKKKKHPKLFSGCVNVEFR